MKSKKTPTSWVLNIKQTLDSQLTQWWNKSCLIIKKTFDPLMEMKTIKIWMLRNIWFMNDKETMCGNCWEPRSLEWLTLWNDYSKVLLANKLIHLCPSRYAVCCRGVWWSLQTVPEFCGVLQPNDGHVVTGRWNVV